MSVFVVGATHSVRGDETPGPAQPGEKGMGAVDARRVAAADAEPGAWLVHGRTWSEQRFSPLDQIHHANLDALGLAWSYETGTRRGLEATPIVVDGTLYATATWSVVFALDAASGRELWRFDPKVPRAKGRDACCDVVNRGVAVWKGRVYVGTIDGRLIALDAATGQSIWEVQTVDPEQPYTITGAPRVVKGKVVIGNGGADFGVRGFVSAYDAESGALVWRFYTVPASKQGPHEHPELDLAATTWPADAMWESGLGATVWDSMAYDPELDLLYVGTGNSSVYNTKFRSPGGGDNLFVASILALRPDTGRLVWHYQTTPGDRWDYTATQSIVLADLRIGGVLRKTLMQAPKNGFFYVLDRETGQLISARNFADVSWASRVDLATGRPVERPEAHWDEEPANVAPAPFGAHSWHPMSFHPGTRLVYIPTMNLAHRYSPDPDFEFKQGHYNTGENFAELAAYMEGLEEMISATCAPTALLAWDPVHQRAAWKNEHATGVPGGVLSTAGNLVFQGNGSGRFSAVHARTGRSLWSADVGIGMMAAPISYEVDGEQYIAVLAGVGGSNGGHATRIDYENEGRVLAWKLGGKATMPAVRKRVVAPIDAPDSTATAEVVVRGRGLYANHCLRCHGVGVRSSGLYPDLRHTSRAVHAGWNDVVLGGTRASKGMASFADVLSPEESLAIQAYVIERATHEPSALERMVGWIGDSPFCVPVRLGLD
jgi:quinohemoprotein ethanol dehydrogenase